MAENLLVTTLDDVVDAGDGVTSLFEAIALAESKSTDAIVQFDVSVLDGSGKGTINLATAFN